MKVCMFTNTYLPHMGGVARSVDFFSRDLRSMGHEVVVAAPVYADTAGDVPEECVIRVPALQNFNGSDFSVSLVLPQKAAARINEFRPDIIHSHHPYLLGDAALRTARRLKCPLVFTHHTLYERYTHYVPLGSGAMGHFAIHLSTRYANLCSGVVAPSRSIAELIRGRGVTVPIRVIPTGVDLAFFRNGDGLRFRRSFGIPEDVPVVGHLGRLAPEKNLDYLAGAVAECLSRENGLFLVAGKGPAAENVRRIFADRNLAGRLVLAPPQAGQDLVDAYHAMDIFVFSSKSETQGMVLAEAMAAGVPVMALDASGVRDVVSDGVNGRLLAGNAQIEDFAHALADVLRDPGHVIPWKREALKTAGRFSRERCAGSLVRFYEQLLDRYAAENDIMDDVLSFETFRRSLKAEWDLLAEKARALKDMLGNHRHE
jgi:glycosyltransferase involved in cell wall biosynthesis